MNAAVQSERLRMLGIMGVDVYVPRTAPIARAVRAAPAVPAVQPQVSSATSHARARVLIRGVGADEASPLLAAVLRGARLRRQDWAMTGEAVCARPVLQFGDFVGKNDAVPAIVLPGLAELRDSVSARRNSWTLLRAWLRRA